MIDAASPATNTPGASTTLRNGSTRARPARSVLVPSILGIGDAATPAVHTTVALGILLPPATTPCSSPVSTLTPSFVSRRVTLRDSGSAKVGVKVLTGVKVETVDEQGVVAGGRRI